MGSEHPADSRRILAVIGPHGGCGKTTLICHLIGHVPALGCLKLSPRHEPASAGPGARPRDRGGYHLAERTVLEQAGSDTGRFLAAGAAHVQWLEYDPHDPSAGLVAALARFPAAIPMVTEGTVAVAHLQPAAVILVTPLSPREMKPSTGAVLEAVTDVVVNGRAGQHHETLSRELRAAYPQLRPMFWWSADLSVGTPPPPFLARIRMLAAPPQRYTSPVPVPRAGSSPGPEA